MRYYIQSFGCQMNEHDMEKVDSLLHVAGFEPAPDMDTARVVIVNTCCVREKAEQKFYSFMGRLRSMKKKRGLVLGVMGCIAQLEKDRLLERLPFIDFALGPSSIHLVTEAIRSGLDKKVFTSFSDNGCLSSPHPGPVAVPPSIKAYVTVMKGCDNFCSYCIVPFVRGREQSRQSADVLDEVGRLAASGVREVTLLGQNVNSYNRGTDDLSFPELLGRIDGIEGIERIRFVTSHPKDLSPELIGCFGSLPKLCEHIHLPLQSGSDKVLRLMNRGYTAEEYREKVARLRERCADMAITADCIVGFPGEEEADFEATMALVAETRFDGVFSFCFSPRSHTAASSLPLTVPPDAARERLQALQSLQKTITRERFEAMEGLKTEVLTEGASKQSGDDLTGRTRTNRIVNFRGPAEMKGKLVEVRITRGYANSLRGAEPRVKEA